MAKGVAHDTETKGAVMAALLAGQRVSEVAHDFGLPEKTVRNWFNGDELAEVAAKKGEALADKTFKTLHTLLDGVIEAVQNATTKEYIERQGAGEVAVLIGVMADKAFRLLAGVGTGEPAEDEATQAEGDVPGIDGGSTPTGS